MKATENVIVKKSFEFALQIIALCTKIEKDRKYAIANQLLKAGTSIGANVREAQSPESRLDFIHKMKIASKEAWETEYWLLLCKYSEHLPDPGSLLVNIEELQKILTAIITTSKNRL
ncbi:MAG TPA: four helix bundle protein [Bacteroidia bacterium]|nr:four helix bundle protein [Bacteroidia bacterium]